MKTNNQEDKPVITAYWNVQNREWALETKEAQRLLDVLPGRIRRKFIGCFLQKDHPAMGEVSDYFISNSDVTRVTRLKPGSAEIFEYLYGRVAPTPIDRYFVECKGGIATYRRLIALEEEIPRLVKKGLHGVEWVNLGGRRAVSGPI